MPVWLLANWKYAVMGFLAVALGIQTLRLSWAQNELIADRLAQAKAVQEQKDKAEALSNELIIAQAAALAVTERTTVEYVDKIRTVKTAAECPSDERDRLGSRGVRAILGGQQPPPK